MSERDIFTAAREMTDPVARSAYMDGACGADTGLRSRVEALLRANDQPDSLLDHPALAAPHDPASGTTRTIGHDGGDGTADEVPLEFLAPATRPDSLGRLGHYEVLQVLGKGGFGIVFRAFDDILQRVVAVKMMAPQLAATSPARKRFLREARTSAAVRHENVVQVYEVAEQPLPYLTMEFIPGETLQQKLNRSGPLEVSEVLRIGRQVAEGLAAAHARDLIHRDIKPGNILLEGGSHKAKITDFGLARAADDASISQSGIIAGTPMFMAPEQALGHKIDQRADLFSLGSVLYQMASGRPPFRAASALAVLKRVAEETPRDIREIIPETPQWLCNIIAKLHEKNPNDRYQTAREIADVLADCEQQLKDHGSLKDFSRIPGGNPQPRRIGRKWKRAAAAVVLLLAVAVGAYAGPFALRYVSDEGKVTFTNDYTEDKLLVRRDGQVVATLDSANGSAHLASGEYELEAVCAEGEEVSSVIAGTRWLFESAPGRGADGPVLKLTIRRGDAIRVGFCVKDKVPPPSLPDGWVRLFNGKDLTGWKETRKGPTGWKVERNVLKAAPGQTLLPSVLSTERTDFRDFHLRMELRTNSSTRASIDVRSDGLVQTVGYGVWLMDVEGKAPIFSLTRQGSTAQKAKPVDVKPEEWYQLEITAYDNVFQVQVDNQLVAKWTDDNPLRTSGPITIFTMVQTGMLEFRKIEIKEFPPSSTPTTFKNGIGMEFVKVPKGKSWLGGGKDKLGDREVVIPADFYLGKYEVTQEEWETITGLTPSYHSRSNELLKDILKEIKDADLKRFPVENVSWEDCQVFLERLNKQEKDKGWVYRLPTAAEWEYACRGGPMADKQDSAFDFYFAKRTNTLLPEQANYLKKDLNRPSKVGAFEANALGLCDMHGNVWEWCEDAEKAPDGASHRVIRGGGSGSDSSDCRAAIRHTYPQSGRGVGIGLRIVRVPSAAASPEVKTPPTDPDRRAAEYVLFLGGTVKVNEQEQQIKAVADLPREPFRLTCIGLDNTKVSDVGLAYFKDCKNLTELWLTNTPVSDTGLAHFRDFKKLTRLSLHGTRVSDGGLAYFKDCKNLTTLHLSKTQVGDAGLSYFKDCKNLTLLDLHETRVSDAGLDYFKNCKNLTVLALQKTQVTAAGIEELKKTLPRCEIHWDGGVIEPKVGFAPFTDADVKRIAALPAAEQIEEVRRALVRRNPGFDGTMEHSRIEGGVVTELRIITDTVTDIAPIRVFSALRMLNCSGTTTNSKHNGQLADLTPLEGMNLASLDHLNLNFTRVSGAGMACFKDCKNLLLLRLHGTQVGDPALAHFKDCKKLTFLTLCNTMVSDEGLAHFKDCKDLTYLKLGGTKLSDTGLAYFKDCKNLTQLFLDDTQVSDAGLAHVKGKPLRVLRINNTAITDLSPLQGMPLEDIVLTPKNIIRGLDILRDMKSLKTIGIGNFQDWPAAEFWAHYDKGEFKE